MFTSIKIDKSSISEQEWLDIFGDNLISLMTEYGYTQGMLARSLNVSKSTISNYVNKVQMPGPRMLVNLAYEFDISLDELMDFGGRIEG